MRYIVYDRAGFDLGSYGTEAEAKARCPSGGSVRAIKTPPRYVLHADGESIAYSTRAEAERARGIFGGVILKED